MKYCRWKNLKYGKLKNGKLTFLNNVLTLIEWSISVNPTLLGVAHFSHFNVRSSQPALCEPHSIHYAFSNFKQKWNGVHSIHFSILFFAILMTNLGTFIQAGMCDGRLGTVDILLC